MPYFEMKCCYIYQAVPLNLSLFSKLVLCYCEIWRQLFVSMATNPHPNWKQQLYLKFKH